MGIQLGDEIELIVSTFRCFLVSSNSIDSLFSDLGVPSLWQTSSYNHLSVQIKLFTGIFNNSVKLRLIRLHNQNIENNLTKLKKKTSL